MLAASWTPSSLGSCERRCCFWTELHHAPPFLECTAPSPGGVCLRLDGRQSPFPRGSQPQLGGPPQGSLSALQPLPAKLFQASPCFLELSSGSARKWGWEALPADSSLSPAGTWRQPLWSVGVFVDPVDGGMLGRKGKVTFRPSGLGWGGWSSWDSTTWAWGASGVLSLTQRQV